MCNYVYKRNTPNEWRCQYDDRKYYGGIRRNREYCIFHLPKKNNIETEKFWEKFRELRSRFGDANYKNWDFIGFRFPESKKNLYQFYSAEKTYIRFLKSKFDGKTDFKGSEFNGTVSFTGCVFNEHVSFLSTLFNANVDFSSCSFFYGVSFDLCRFYKRASFDKSRFCLQIGFYETKFLSIDHNVSFIEAIFEPSNEKIHIDFEEDAIEGWKIATQACFISTEFKGHATFTGARFLCNADFKYSVFESSVNFTGRTKFYLEARFHNARFLKRVDFSNAEFLGTTFFNWAVFEKEVFYSNATLMGVHFDATIFQGPVYFTGSFINLLRFDRTIFSVQPSFFSMQISESKNAEIKYLICDSNIEFLNGYLERINDREIEYPCIIKLTECSLGGNLLIRAMLNNIEISDCTFKAVVNIEPKNLEYKANVKIRNSNFLSDSIISNVYISELKNCIITNLLVIKNSLLCRAELEGTVDLRKIDFINVTWPKINRKRHLKWIKSLQNVSVIYDELLKIHGKPEDYEKVDLCNNAVTSQKMEKKDVNNKEKQIDIINLEEMYRSIASSYESRARYGSSGAFKVGEFDLRKYRKKDISRLERIVIRAYRLLASYGESIWKPIAGILITAFIPTFIYLLSGDYCFQQSLYYSIKGCFSFGSEIVGQSGEFLTFIPFIQKLSLLLFIPLFLFALRRRVKR